MKKTRRNDQCKCGSGKKHKRCCGDPGKSLVAVDTSVALSFFQKYNTTDLLQSIAGLSILKENHGKNYRFEKITEDAIRHFNDNVLMTPVVELKSFFEEKYSSEAMEDLPFNLFTDLVTFHGGDYLIFPGISDSTAFILNNLLKAIFQNPDNKLSDEFLKIIYKSSLLILELSDHIVKVIGYTRYQIGEVDKGHIRFPIEENLKLLKKAVMVTEPEMNG